MTPPKKAAKKTSIPKTRRLVIKDDGKFSPKGLNKIKPGDLVKIVASEGKCFDIKIKIKPFNCGGVGGGGPIIIHSGG